jgi:integral membrane protein (TIGR01906 family)
MVIFLFLLSLSFLITTNAEIFYKINLKDYDNNKEVVINVLNYLNQNSELNKELFNEKEVLHLKDVQVLFFIAKLIFILSLIAFVVWLRKDLKTIFKANIYSFILSLIICLILYIVNFKFLFLNFHKLVFFNNYWLLDPSKDLLINLFPSKFFQNFFYLWLTLILLLHLIFFILLKVILNKKAYKS